MFVYIVKSEEPKVFYHLNDAERYVYGLKCEWYIYRVYLENSLRASL